MTEQSVVLQFATNHLSTFLFTNLLLPSMLQVKEARKRGINTASETCIISPVRFSDINQDLGKGVLKNEQPRQGLPEDLLRNDGGYESLMDKVRLQIHCSVFA